MSEIKCPNCGALFDPHEPKCPYCEYINPAGAQEQYMKKLEQNRLKLDNVDEEAAELYHSEMKKKGKRLAVTAGVTAAVIILGVLFFALKDRFFKPSYTRSPEDQVKEIAWQKETFPKLDALYEAGEYDELLNMYRSFDVSHEIWNWQHYNFLDCLVRFSIFTDMMENYPRYVSEGNASAISVILYQAARFYYRDYTNETSLSESDLDYLESFAVYAESVVREKLHFSDDEMEELKAEIYTKGYVDSGACEKVAKRYLDRFTE